jgi:hypothetical protein
VHGPNVLHKRSAPMPIKRHEARSGPGTARPGLGDVPVGLKKQRTAAKAKNKGPHWSPVEILVGRRQPEPPNATLCLPPCCGQGHTPFTQLCAPTRAQAAALVGVHVNERHSLSPTSFRETAADKSFPGVLEQLCGSSGKHTFPTKETGRGPTKKIWTLDDALKRPETGPGCVYRHFKTTVAYARGTLNPLYAALCVKGPNGQLIFPSGWQKQDMIDGIKYNLANQSKVVEDLVIVVPEKDRGLQSEGDAPTPPSDAPAPSDDNGGGGVGGMPKSPIPKRAAADEACRALMSISGSEADSGSDPEWMSSQSPPGVADDDGREEEEVTDPPSPPKPHPQALPQGTCQARGVQARGGG